VVDWVGIGNSGHDVWRRELAAAARTSIERVAVHTVHQHDTPGCDFSSEELLAVRGFGGTAFDSPFAREVIARTAHTVREALRDPHPVTHIHFNGAGGNVAAGKYNDGLPGRRLELAGRLAEGMAAAWESTQKHAVSGSDVDWRIIPVALPPRKALDEAALQAKLDDPQAERRERLRAARNLVWLRRCRSGQLIELNALRIGPAMVLHMPGELFVEYQLAAQRMRADRLVCMAAYGDYGPGYIGTEIAYSQGGYETGEASRVAPSVEAVLMAAMDKLLED
jgi:hypothetical protein